jgi:hypothetical protein
MRMKKKANPLFSMKRRFVDFVSGGFVDQSNDKAEDGVNSVDKNQDSKEASTTNISQLTSEQLYRSLVSSSSSQSSQSSSNTSSLSDTSRRRRKLESNTDVVVKQESLSNVSAVVIVPDTDDTVVENSFVYCDLCKFLIEKSEIDKHMSTIKHNFEQVIFVFCVALQIIFVS